MKPSRILLLAVWLGFLPMYLGNKPLCFPSGNCYTVLVTGLPFYNANMSCGPKGSLTTMKNNQEKKETLQFATNIQTRTNISEFWIGLHLPGKNCIKTDNNLYGFMWISGEEDTQVSEWDKIPKRSCTKNKKCVVLQSRSGSTTSGLGNLTWFWNNKNCNNKRASICRFPKDFSPSEDVEIFSPPPTDQPLKFTYSTIKTTERIPSTINVICTERIGNETNTCEVENIPYSCNDTHCFCGQMDDNGKGYGLRRCQASLESCLGQCIWSSNISCACRDHETSCDQGDCTINTSITAISTSPLVHTATSSPLNDDDENLFERLVLPLILGLVALGILIMLVWGGVQMCVRKRKPKRKKSIVPVAEEPEASDTDSTDNSSSDEEGDSQDMAEMAS